MGPLSAISLLNMDRSHARLEGLPAEVFLNVASYLDSHQAAALRCTCKRLATLASGAVFAFIPISLQRSVLAKFKKFAARAHIGSNIETLVVTPYLCQSPTLRCWLEGNIQIGTHGNSNHSCPWSGRHGEVKLEFLEEYALEEILDDARRAREQWEEQDEPSFNEEENEALISLPRRLREAVKNAKEQRHWQLPVTPESMAGILNLMPNLRHVKFRTIGIMLYHDLAEGDAWSNDDWHGQLARIFLYQLETSDISPESLSAEGEEFPPFPIGMFNSLSCIRNRLEASEANPLRKLRLLNLSALHATSEERQGGFATMFADSGLAHLISCAPLLEVLRIDIGFTPCPLINLDDLVRFQNSLQRLRKVAFSNFRIESANLSQWLEQSCDTLQHIELRYMTLSTGHWIELMDAMRVSRYRRLQSFSIETCATIVHELFSSEGETVLEGTLHGWHYAPEHSHELIEYVTGQTERNPWYFRYATLLPRL